MNRKFKISIVVCLFVVIFVVLLHNVFINDYTINVISALNERVKSDQDFKFGFKLFMLFIYASLGAVFSRICFVIASRKGLDPWKWAKYGFLFNLWAVFYLVLLEDEQKNR